jgi:hypothetical protein
MGWDIGINVTEDLTALRMEAALLPQSVGSYLIINTAQHPRRRET